MTTTFIIGRNPSVKDGEIAIIFDDYTKQVDNNHCKITCEGIDCNFDKNIFYIEDLDSTLGTYVSGEKIDKKTSLTGFPLISLGNKDIFFSLKNNLIINETLKEKCINLRKENIAKENELKLKFPKDKVDKSSNVSLFLFIGAIIGIPLSYYFQSESLQNANGGVVGYIKKFDQIDDESILGNIFLGIIIFALIGGVIGLLIDNSKKKSN